MLDRSEPEPVQELVMVKLDFQEALVGENIPTTEAPLTTINITVCHIMDHGFILLSLSEKKNPKFNLISFYSLL